MGKVRAFSPHVRWTDAEEAVIREHYPSAPYEVLEQMLPGRTRRIIQGKAFQMKVQRIKAPPMTPEQRLARKYEQIRAKREQNPDAVREYQKLWRARNRDRINAELREQVARRLFWGRALRLRGVSAFDLWKLWKSQRGRCALSGRKLDRSAEIDHKIPKVRGGKDDLANLQWTTVEANRAKRDLTDDEFFALCSDVCGRLIFDRMRMVEERWPAERMEAAE